MSNLRLLLDRHLCFLRVERCSLSLERELLRFHSLEILDRLSLGFLELFDEKKAQVETQ